MKLCRAAAVLFLVAAVSPNFELPARSDTNWQHCESIGERKQSAGLDGEGGRPSGGPGQRVS